MKWRICICENNVDYIDRAAAKGGCVIGLKTRRALQGFLLFLAMIVIAATAESREIRDMVGRKVIVPEAIKKVYSTSPPSTYMIYALDPDLLMALNTPFTEDQKKYLKKNVPDLPAIGGFFGQSQAVNVEVLLKNKPDVAVVWTWKQNIPPQSAQFEEMMQKMGIPVAYLALDNVSGYPDAFSFLGRLFKKEDRAAVLSRYGRDSLSEVRKVVAGVPLSRRPKVYYAEGVDGLSTECADSIHAELIVLAGGRNVHQCKQKSLMGMEKISLEQVMLYDPDVIVTQEKSFHESVFKDQRWRGIRAVRTRQVHLIPKVPFNWFDRPPSFMRFLGLKWLANILYPDAYRINIAKETREFYRLFLGVDLKDEEMRKVLNMN
ncbi:ABC transporter substrate-binding protein [Syntrophorhabdus aromaticivorans]|uniref:ABC transporter substrate-binding protein n=1 Tax=Syntrophorhabdus aromaticivorans TaxID=328301 RepID=UPI000418BA6C|nr:ABC transporter substrate-binding protein [Syntrophorhabdus aromaticivorans]